MTASTLDRLFAAASQRPAHAYLLVGQRDASHEAARRLAARLVSVDPEGEVSAGTGPHPDVTWFEPEGAALYLAAQGDQIMTDASRAPLSAERRVLVLEAAELLGTVLESSLLKTLEEPAASTTFVLCAGDLAGLPETIVSRCVVVHVPPLAPAEAGRRLAAEIPGADADEAAALVRATGSFEFARDVLADESWRRRRRMWLEIPPRLVANPVSIVMGEVETDLEDAAAAVAESQAEEQAELEEYLGEGALKRGRAAQARKRALNQLAERQKRAARSSANADHRRLLATLAGWYRDVLAVLEGAEPLNVEVAGEIREQALDVGREDALRALARLEEANEALMLNANASLVIEDVLIQLRPVPT